MCVVGIVRLKLLRRATEPSWRSWRCVPGETRLTTEPRWTPGPWPRHHLQMETHRATQDHAYCYNLHAVIKEGSAIAGKTVVPNNLNDYFAILPNVSWLWLCRYITGQQCKSRTSTPHVMWCELEQGGGIVPSHTSRDIKHKRRFAGCKSVSLCDLVW